MLTGTVTCDMYCSEVFETDIILKGVGKVHLKMLLEDQKPTRLKDDVVTAYDTGGVELPEVRFIPPGEDSEVGGCLGLVRNKELADLVRAMIKAVDGLKRMMRVGETFTVTV